MKEEYTQIVDMLQKAADEIETPPFEARYKAIESKLGPAVYDKANVQKKKSFHIKWKSPFMIASYVCAVLAISLGLGFGLGYKSNNGIIQSEKSYYIDDVLFNKDTPEQILEYNKDLNVYLPNLDDKKDALFYSLRDRNDKALLGLRFYFTSYSEDDYFAATITICSKVVIDAAIIYSHGNNTVTIQDNIIKYSYIDYDGTFYAYKGMFEHGDYNYLIDYNSISEDFEQGIATIF